MPRTPSVPQIPSPCTGICALDPASGLCRGCLRSAAEIAEWRDADMARRLAILEELRRRRRQAGRTSPADSRPRRRRGA